MEAGAEDGVEVGANDGVLDVGANDGVEAGADVGVENGINTGMQEICEEEETRQILVEEVGEDSGGEQEDEFVASLHYLNQVMLKL